MKINGISEKQYYTAINDVVIVNGVLVLKVNKVRRNRKFLSYFKTSNVYHTFAKGLNRILDSYHYLGGIELLEELMFLTGGRVVDIIGEDSVKAFYKFYSQFSQEIPYTIILYHYKDLNQKTISFTRRLYYNFMMNIIDDLKTHIYPENHHNRIIIKSQPLIDDYNPLYINYNFMTLAGEFRRITPPKVWKYTTFSDNFTNLKLRAYPYLGKSKNKFIIIRSHDDLDKYTQEFGEWFRTLYYYLETNPIKSMVKYTK